MSEKIRLGFIGAGNMGQIAHLRNYAQLGDECELVAIADLRTSLAEEVARRYGIAEVYPDHTSLLANADVDAVVAIMGYSHHHNVVPDILNAGKHLLTEKPIANDYRHAGVWKQIADDNDLVYLVGYMKRWDIGARRVHELVKQWRESGDYGEMRYVRCDMSGTDWTWGHDAALHAPRGGKVADGPPPVAEAFPEHFDAEETSYYNMNINFYVHQANLLRFLLSEDYELTYTHPGGKVLLATTDSGTAISLEMSVHGINQTWDETYRICFDHAEIDLRLPAPLQRQQNGEVVIRRNTADGSRETVLPNVDLPSWSFFEQAKGFLECIRAGSIPYDSVGDAIKDLAVFERQVELMRSVDGNIKA
jgi:predicted dehydrogenase